MRQQRPSYETPGKAWYEPRIEEEKNLIESYGLKNKREVWKAQSTVRTWRREARKLTATQDEDREQELLDKLHRLGLVSSDASLDDILELETDDLLDRRLQTVVYRKGLANTVKQARQFVVHGHVRIDNTRVDIPSYFVRADEEEDITVADTVLQHVTGEAADTRTTSVEETSDSEEDVEEAAEEDEAEEADVDEDELRESETADVVEEAEEDAEPAELTPADIVSGTVSEAKEQLEAFDGSIEQVLEAEKNGKNRKTLVSHLENQIESEED